MGSAVYRYVAYDAERKVVEGTIGAATEALAREALQRSGYRLLVLKAARPRVSLRKLFPTLFGVKARDVIVFSRLLATLLERGTNIIAALQLLREQARNPTFREVIASVIQELNQGNSLSEAIGRHPQVFPMVYRRLLRLSEQTGNLEGALRQVADYMEREAAALAKVARALVYPAFILLVAVGVIGILMTVVLPSLIGVFEQFDAQLPPTTRLLIALTGFLSSYKLYLLAAAVGGGALAYWYLRRPRGRRLLNRAMLKLPILGRITLTREMVHFSRTMSMLLEAGLPMTEVVQMVAQTARNGVVAEALEEVRRGILRGRGLSRPMADHELFPRLLVQIVRVGEEAGTLGEDLAVVTELYNQEIEERVDSLVHLLEPCLFLVLGAIVAFIALSVIMPIYTVMSSIQ